MSKIVDNIYNRMMAMLEQMAQDPNTVTEADKGKLDALYSKLCKTMGVSEHSKWAVQWQVEKWFDVARHKAGCKPDEVALASQNIIVDKGAEEMLKLIAGTGGTAFGSNSYVYVGNDATAEQASQTGIIAKATGVENTDWSVAQVTEVTSSSRQLIYRASFDVDKGNFAWNELSIANGNGVNAIAMNRKKDNLGTKNGGVWTVQITLSLTSA